MIKTKSFNNWSIDIYVVDRKKRAIKAGLQQRYELRKLDGSVLKKRFYRDDLLKISNTTTGDNSTLGKVDDNPPEIEEHEILFEVKPEPTDETPEVIEPVKKGRKPREKLVVPLREKSTRLIKAPNRLDL